MKESEMIWSSYLKVNSSNLKRKAGLLRKLGDEFQKAVWKEYLNGRNKSIVEVY